MSKDTLRPDAGELLSDEKEGSEKPKVTQTNVLFAVVTFCNRSVRRAFSSVSTLVPFVAWAGGFIAACLAIAGAVYLAVQIMTMVFTLSPVLGWIIVGLLAVNGLISLATMAGWMIRAQQTAVKISEA